MKIRNAFLIAVAALLPAMPASAMSKKPKITVRFHTEANERDSGTFAMPVDLAYAQRKAVLSRVPEFSERQVEAIFPFEAGDGTWGCAFKLDPQGRIRLDTMSNQQRGSALVVFVGTDAGQHQVVDMVIDRPVPNGIITVPRGLTALEIGFLRKEFPVLGEKKEEKKSKMTGWFGRKKKSDAGSGGIDRDRDARENAERAATGRPAAADADLPRLSD